jgi:hypothetical protein
VIQGTLSVEFDDLESDEKNFPSLLNKARLGIAPVESTSLTPISPFPSKLYPSVPIQHF